MKPTQKIIFNTAVLYMKIVICMAISICTVPIVLHSLGESDYGLFNLIAGIISMLAFINGAMTVSTQRYLSVTIGEKDKNKLLQIYNISILLHIIIGLIIVLLIEGSIPILFKYFLNINSGQEDVAHLLFHFLVISMFFSVVTVPFDAVLNSYENMLFFSISGIIEYLLKLAVALSLTLFSSARLEIYGISITLITILVLIIKYVYCRNKYKDLHISPRSCRNKKLFIEMFGFAGWNTLSSLAMVSRNQGIAIILNHFHGTVINAAYGIANQVNAALGYFSSTIQKSINPQLMESEGLHAQERLQNLTFALTKYSVLILGAMSLPVIIELPFITGIWIGNVPQYTIEFTRIIIILSLITQSSSGLMSAVQSSGRVKWYTTSVSIMLLITLPLSYFALKYFLIPTYALLIACVIEIAVFFVRLMFANKLQSIPVWEYISKAILPNLAIFISIGACLYAITTIMETSFIRLIIVTSLDISLYCILAYHLAMNKGEKEYICNVAKKIKKKIKK